MKLFLSVCLAVASLTTVLTAQGTKGASPKKLALTDLPPAVQKGVQDGSKGAEIKNISKETEHGVVQYEVETMLNGKHRDFNVDTKGVILATEEETSLEQIPAAAKAAILNRSGKGKLGVVEVLKKGNETLYEAAYTTPGGKKHEVLVKADGTRVHQ